MDSRIFRNMSNRLQSLFPLPKKEDFKENLPTKANCLNWNPEQVSAASLREVPIFDVLNDRLLYEEFFNYAKKHRFQKCLHITRAIASFRDNFYRYGAHEAEDEAWRIFSYFICRGSAYEIFDLDIEIVEEIMMKLAHPDPDMFIDVENVTNSFVCSKYIAYSISKEFNYLPARLFSSILDQRLVDRKQGKDHTYAHSPSNSSDNSASSGSSSNSGSSKHLGFDFSRRKSIVSGIDGNEFIRRSSHF